MSLGAKIPYIVTPSEQGIAPLEPGDHLTRDEFERRFDATPGLKKAELIEGQVKRLPLLSNAKPSGAPGTVANVLTEPVGVIILTVLVPLDA